MVGEFFPRFPLQTGSSKLKSGAVQALGPSHGLADISSIRS